MKAILYTQYGSPDVLQYTDVAKPTPQANEVLVKIIAASANPLDWHLMRAEPFLARLEAGLRKPKNPKLGADIAGIVEAVGANVSEFNVGDAVFGDVSSVGLGAFAEYVCVPEDKIALKPANITFEQAAGVGVAGFTALQGLRDKGEIKAGQKVLVNGASGGVGTFAVQIAKSYGTEVTGVCSTRNLDLVRSIGADHVIDYTQEDFTRSGKTYDLIFDAVGNHSVSDYKRALTPDGICSIAGFTTMPRLLEHMILGPLRSRNGQRQVGIMKTAYSNKADLLILRELLESGKVVPVIDRAYPLTETADAIRYLETARARGKVIINVAPVS
ncbi:MAG: NAD(P)-dependent alcohol dehydrogenase [Aggregatilineales bacterium]